MNITKLNHCKKVILQSKALLVSVFILFSNCLYSQQSAIDSLKAVLNKETNDSLKFRIYIEIAKKFTQKSIDSSFLYNQKAAGLIKTAGLTDSSYYFLLQFNKSNIYADNNKYKETIEVLLPLQKWLGEKHNILYITQVYGQLAYTYMRIGRSDDSKKYFLKALENEKIFNPSNLCKVYLNVGSLYKDLGSPDSSYLFYTKALELARETKNLQDLGKIHGNLGILFDSKDSMELALYHFKKGVEIFDQTELKLDQLKSRIDLGTSFLSVNDLEMAGKMLDEAVRKGKELDNNSLTSLALINLSDVYSKQDDYEYSLELLEEAKQLIAGKILYYEAHIANEKVRLKLLVNKIDSNVINYVTEAMSLCKKLGYPSLIGYSYLGAGEYFLNINDFNQSKVFLDSASTLFKNTNNTEGYLDAYIKTAELKIRLDLPLDFDEINQLADKAIELKKYKRASNLLKIASSHFVDNNKKALLLNKLVETNDFLYSTEKSKQLRDIKIKYETDKKEQQIALKDKQLKLTAASLEQQNLILFMTIAGLIIALGLSLLLYALWKSTSKRKALEVRLNGELEHSMRGGLNELRIQLATRLEVSKDTHLKMTLNTIDRLISNLQLIHKSIDETGQVKLADFFNHKIENYIDIHEAHHLSATIDITPVSVNTKVATVLGNMVDEMVHNALKYAFKHVDQPKLIVNFYKEGKVWKLYVQDNGPGFDPNLRPQGTGHGIGFILDSISDIGATYTLSHDAGTCWEVEIPDSYLKKTKP